MGGDRERRESGYVTWISDKQSGEDGTPLGDSGLKRRTCGIADDGQEDQADELLADGSGTCHTINGVNQELSSHRNQLWEKVSQV